MTTGNTHKHALTDLQKAILDVIWAKGEATAEEVRAAVRDKHPLTDSSVRTLLRRLEARGFLAHRVEAKLFVYRAAVGPKRMAARAVQQIIERFWSGSAEQFLIGMVDEKVLPAATLKRLAQRVKKTR